MTILSALRAWWLERRIQAAWKRVQAAQLDGTAYALRKALWAELVRLHSMRSLEQVERLERAKGLR
jgi:hypothetical protein